MSKNQNKPRAQYTQRLSWSLNEKLVDAADKNHRTKNAEIESRLEKSFETEGEARS